MTPSPRPDGHKYNLTMGESTGMYTVNKSIYKVYTQKVAFLRIEYSILNTEEKTKKAFYNHNILKSCSCVCTFISRPLIEEIKHFKSLVFLDRVLIHVLRCTDDIYPVYCV